jgi:hypothetical protein
VKFWVMTRRQVAAAASIVALAATLATIVNAPRADAAAGCDAFAPGSSRGSVNALGLEEASGLVAGRTNPGILWAHADSGTAPRLYALNAADASLVASFDLIGAANVDWEDLAVGPGLVPGENFLYIGDIGGNTSSRADLVYRVAEPAVDPAAGPGPHALPGTVELPFSYPDSPRDAESLMADPVSGELFIVTKPSPSDLSQVLSPTPVFRYPKPHDGTSTALEEVAGLDFSKPPLKGSALNSYFATGGDISPSGDEILIRTYSTAFVWPRDAGESVVDALGGTPCPVPLQTEPQGEAIGYAADGKSYFTLSEQAGQGAQPLYQYQCAHGFTDVPGWVDDAVDWMICEDYATGYDDGTFRPTWNITRAQDARMVHRLFGEPAPGGGFTHSFTDVPPWVSAAANWMNWPGGPASPEPLMSGYGSTFAPNANITRAQKARQLFRAAGSPAIDASCPATHGFSDVPPWVDEAVRWLTCPAHGPGGSTAIATGYRDGTFRPNNPITRAETARMLQRFDEAGHPDA